MRLIRLTTDNNRGIFSNDFNTDIYITKGQQVALQSASFHEDTGQIILNSFNNQIVFTYDDNQTALTIDLATGTFNNVNHNDLLRDITTKLNNALVSPVAPATFRKRFLIGLVFRVPPCKW